MGTIIAILLAVLGLFSQTAGTPSRNFRFGPCTATTKAGRPCKSGATSDEGLCGPHRDQAYRLLGAEEAASNSDPTPDPIPVGKWAGLFLVGGTGARSLRTANIIEQKAVWAWLLITLTTLKAVHGDSLRVVSGMAEGFDEALAKAALHLNIPVIAMLPNAGYGRYYWGRNSLTGRDRFEEFEQLLSRCNQVIYTDRLFKIAGKGLYYDPHTRKAFFRRAKGLVHSNFVRNQGLVNWSDELLVYQSESSGTSDCVTRAKKAGIPMRVFSS